MGTAHGRMCTEWDGNLKLIVPCETGSCICSFVAVNDTKLNSSDCPSQIISFASSLSDKVVSSKAAESCFLALVRLLLGL